MATISQFRDITIEMFYRDHLPPHFHATYGEYEALIAIPKPTLLRGQLPRRMLALVIDWAELHRAELEDNWQRARRREEFRPVEPLG